MSARVESTIQLRQYTPSSNERESVPRHRLRSPQTSVENGTNITCLSTSGKSIRDGLSIRRIGFNGMSSRLLASQKRSKFSKPTSNGTPSPCQFLIRFYLGAQTMTTYL